MIASIFEGIVTFCQPRETLTAVISTASHEGRRRKRQYISPVSIETVRNVQQRCIENIRFFPMIGNFESWHIYGECGARRTGISCLYIFPSRTIFRNCILLTRIQFIIETADRRIVSCYDYKWILRSWNNDFSSFHSKFQRKKKKQRERESNRIVSTKRKRDINCRMLIAIYHRYHFKGGR